jgi:hypothetical protein
VNERHVILISPSVIFLGAGRVNERPLYKRSPTTGFTAATTGLGATTDADATTGVGAAPIANLATGAAETTGRGAAHGAAYDIVVGAETTIVGGDGDRSG